MKETPFDKLGGEDGFTVFSHELGTLEITLHAGMRQEGVLLGERFHPKQIWVAEKPTVPDYGARTRIELLAEAVFRFLNTGGEWAELEDLLRPMKEFAPFPLVFPGWHYHDGYIDTEGHFTHIFLKDGGTEVIRWVTGPGGYVQDGLTLADLQQEIEEDAENQRAASGPEAYASQSRFRHPRIESAPPDPGGSG